ncbi:hypothetical protein CDD83_2897 [Cordyceps sp. RAO-2017]|nr:hypothetical protein CDD83_2897 [Cordyceps sp. RAO-2017]
MADDSVPPMPPPPPPPPAARRPRRGSAASLASLSTVLSSSSSSSTVTSSSTTTASSASSPSCFSFGAPLPCPFATVTAAFYHQASTCPASTTAVRDLSAAAPRELTYRQLARHAQALALRLRALGVQPGDRIPLVVRRGLEMLVAIWAVLSCGAQYVPLDGGVVPDSTVDHVVRQSGGDVVLCLEATEHRVRNLFPHLAPVLVDHG